MHFNPKALGLAAGIISFIVSLLCIIFIAIAPNATMNTFGWLIHIGNLADLLGQRTITLANSVVGLIVSFISAYILGWLFAVLYNKFLTKQQ